MTDELAEYEGGFVDRMAQPRRVIEWIVAVTMVLIGLGTVGVGLLIRVWPDRNWIAEQVAKGNIESDVLTDAELIDLVFESTVWGGNGIAAVGVLFVVAGLLVAVSRYRADRSDASAAPGTFWMNALLGSIVTVLTSFVPFSPLIGGGIAGYLHLNDRWSGVLVGAVSGGLVSVPLLLFLALISIGLAQVEFGFIAVLVFAGAFFGALFTIGLSAVGGYLGTYLRERA